MSADSRKALKEKGLKIRRQVLGDKYVDAALENRNAFNNGLQDLLNEYCWGAGWSDNTLSRRERSLINLGMLTALGKSHEIATHTRGARNNGLTNKEIAAAFLQAAVYCGVPAAVDSFRAANPVLKEYDAELRAEKAKAKKKAAKKKASKKKTTAKKKA